MVVRSGALTSLLWSDFRRSWGSRSRTGRAGQLGAIREAPSLTLVLLPGFLGRRALKVSALGLLKRNLSHDLRWLDVVDAFNHFESLLHLLVLRVELLANLNFGFFDGLDLSEELCSVNPEDYSRARSASDSCKSRLTVDHIVVAEKLTAG